MVRESARIYYRGNYYRGLIPLLLLMQKIAIIEGINHAYTELPGFGIRKRIR
nr:MAG TPA: hypothetical protein [Caudoviricetes sp.]